ncbi:helix-turn-helix domain-containing protein [Bacillus sp. FJAT-45066]|uniref:helix-turn-helix domain-containing protein n=1 Tax=Bacillus sp. FJAT-45066 TaxID=2011010 RepID=UPI000BB760C9|nr:helix-turn-helix transcriptional regulator [Bacillus sp. FJAT-45066]
MNNYLIMLGSNFTDIRQLLNLTQEDLANKMGVSRPTIVKIEQDPSRLTKTLAFAFFVSISYEIKKRIKEVKNINPSAYKSPDSLNTYMKVISGTSLLSAGTIAATATRSLGAVLPGIGVAIATAVGIKWGLKALKGNVKNEVEQKIKWDEEKAKKVLEEVQKKLLEDKTRLLSYLELSSLDISQFVEKINNNEITEEEEQ